MEEFKTERRKHLQASREKKPVTFKRKRMSMAPTTLDDEGHRIVPLALGGKMIFNVEFNPSKLSTKYDIFRHSKIREISLPNASSYEVT